MKTLKENWIPYDFSNETGEVVTDDVYGDPGYDSWSGKEYRWALQVFRGCVMFFVSKKFVFGRDYLIKMIEGRREVDFQLWDLRKSELCAVQMD